MNIFLRILLAVYAFFMTILSLICMIITFKHDILGRIYYFLSVDVLTSTNASIVMFAISFIFFALSLTFLNSGFRNSKDKRGISKYTNIGEIKISLNSIENIALNTSRKVMGVRDTKAYVSHKDEGVKILIKAVVMPDINIPTLSEDMQFRVKNSIEDCTGVKVVDIKVLVENIYTGYKARVE